MLSLVTLAGIGLIAILLRQVLAPFESRVLTKSKILMLTVLSTVLFHRI